MNKKVMIILVICLVVIIGGALGFWMKTKESNKATPKNAEAVIQARRIGILMQLRTTTKSL
ncbi:hypothetical protein F6Y05_39810 [Bacillus megaterium]|nr:hypothetical protein [Priestia megaterium]